MSSALKHQSPEKPASGRPPAGPNTTPMPAKRAPSITSAKTPDKGSEHGSTIPRRRSSVQFAEDTKKEDEVIRRPSAGKDTNGGFRQNMSDFLTVMYGAEGKNVASTTKPPIASGGKDNPLSHNRASMYKSAAGNTSSRGSGGAVMKGPLVKGKTAHDGADNIDTLVDHLVRAYSRKSTGNGFGGTGGGVGDAPVSYGNRTTVSPGSYRHRQGQSSEVSDFVSQALDGFLDNTSLSSKKSMLSSLGVDQNFAKLLSFHPNSNMINEDDDSDNSLLEPRKIGEQAMFKSIGSRLQQPDASISKSVEMRGIIPPPPSGEEVMTGLSAPKAKARANTNDMSLNSAQLTAPKRPAQPKGKSLARPMSLDSRALGGHLEADDSWGDVDAEAAELEKKEKAKVEAAAVPAAPAGAHNGKGPAVSNMRSLMNYSKERAALTEAIAKLEEEEELNRNVTIAVEKQLRGYLVTGVKQTPKGPPAGAGAKGKLPAGKGPAVGTRKVAL